MTFSITINITRHSTFSMMALNAHAECLFILTVTFKPIMLNVIILSVVVLNVMAPLTTPRERKLSYTHCFIPPPTPPPPPKSVIGVEPKKKKY